VAGILLCLATFVLFYLMIVFALSWERRAGFRAEKFLLMQLFATLFFAVTVPISAKLAEHGRRRTMLWITTAIGLFGWCWADVSGWNGERDCDHGAGLSLMG